MSGGPPALQCPRCGNRENILVQSIRGAGPDGVLKSGSQIFCPKCKLTESAFDGAAEATLLERWGKRP